VWTSSGQVSPSSHKCQDPRVTGRGTPRLQHQNAVKFAYSQRYESLSAQLVWSKQHLLIGDIAGEVASTQYTIQPSPPSITRMGSITDHTFHLLSRHMSNENEEADFPLYPDSSNMFSQSFQFNGALNYNMDAFSYPRTQEGHPASTGLNSSTVYAEPQYESPDPRTAPSNYSTASGPSASSSTMGSPHSIHTHTVPGPEYGLGLTPGIASYNDYGHNEYTFQATGIIDFTLEFNPVKTNLDGFVGECKTISRSAPRQHGSISSNPESLSSLSTFVTSPNTMNTPTPTRSDSAARSMASPITPASAMRMASPDESFKSPSVSAFSGSPSSSSRQPSQAFNAPLYASSSTTGRPQNMRLSPISSVSQPFTSEQSPSYTTYHQSPFFSQSSGNFVPPLESSCWFPLSIQRRGFAFQSASKNLLTDFSLDPLILHPPYAGRPSSATQSNETPVYPPPQYPPASPSFSQMSKSPRPVKQGSQSPYHSSYEPTFPYPPPRRPSLASHQSYSSDRGDFSSEESKEKGRCTYPECGKLFKDLKAHMLTHQNERPEKCPILTCDYHIKGFARKYDKNRHTLTHYKGTMVCGFCPGSGSTAEKSFNRADVFKRHLTSVHGVELTPPGSRKNMLHSENIGDGKKLSGRAPYATGKCSTCSSIFSNSQDFYEHLDDCVLRVMQQETETAGFT